MRRLQSRMLKGYALLLLACLPFALRDPSRRLPGMVPILAFEHRLLHPSLWLPWVEAGPKVEAEWQPDSYEKRALQQLDLGLKQQAHPRASERLKVRRAEGEGGAGWPDILLAEKQWSDEDRDWLQHCPVVRGMDLVGFVFVPDDPNLRHRLQSQGLLQIRLLNHRASGAERRRFAAMAQCLAEGPGVTPRPIRLILEASVAKAPYPLHSLRSSPEQADTWSRGSFLVKLMKSTELHPSLPDGLILGWIRDEVYEREGFVQSRWVLPRWHPSGLVQVELLGAPEAASKSQGSPELSGVWPARRRTEAKVVWRSPESLGYRRYLLRGTALQAGMAILSGARCLGRIEWAYGGIALAVPLSKRGSVLPMLWWGGEDQRVEAFLVEGMGSTLHSDRFRLIHPTVLEPGFLDQGLLFTGTLGRSFPAGLLITDLFHLEGNKILRLDNETLLSWPELVEVSALGEVVR